MKYLPRSFVVPFGLLGAMLVVGVAGCGGGNGGTPDVAPTDASMNVRPDAALNRCPSGNDAIQRAILVPRCGSCHGATSPQAGLDLVSPDVASRLTNVPSTQCADRILVVPGNPAQSYFLQKVTDAMPACGAIMPPTSQQVDDLGVACLQAWIEGGLQPTGADAGATDYDAGFVWAPTPGTTRTCTDADGRLRANMCPGADCLTCHNPTGSAFHADQLFTVAGTVFRNPTDPVTAGVAGARVHIVDAEGTILNLTTNAVGNFYTLRGLVFPLTTEISMTPAAPVPMPIQVPTGSCNSCHTLPSANGTSGRIFLGP